MRLSIVDGIVKDGLLPNVVRDLAVASGALSLWGAAETWHAVTGLWLAQAVAVVDGVLAGLLLGFLLHEWGHFLGALASGAKTVIKPPLKRGLLLFDYDYAANDGRQFQWMTIGGHFGHWGSLILLIIAVPLESPSGIALVGAVFGFAIFASFIEVPVLKDTWSGADPGSRLKELTRSTVRRAASVGALSGVLAVVVLS